MKASQFFAKSMLAASLALGSIGIAWAGTPNLTGVYAGNHNLTMRSSDNVIRGVSTFSPAWVFNFDAKTATISNGAVSGPMGTFAYAAHPQSGQSHVTITDNLDGTYTLAYNFQAYNPNFGNPVGPTTSTLEITEDGAGNISVVTLDVEPGGTPDGVIGTRLSGYGFPFVVERDWTGTATLQ